MPDYSEKIRTITSNSRKQAEDRFEPESMDIEELAIKLGSHLGNGLTDDEVKKIRREKGTNALYDEIKTGFTSSFKNQLQGLMGIFLASVAFLMYVFQPERHELIVLGVTVIIIMFINAVLEASASHSLEKIRNYSAIRATVTRNGRRFVIDSRGLVPGDIITLETGNIVPADARIISCAHLSVLEASINGKNEAVYKSSAIEYNRPDMLCHTNMVYAGTVVTGGSGTAIVCETGKNVLTRKVNTKHSQDYTPGLLKYASHVGKAMSFVSVIICFVLLVLGIATGRSITDMFILSLTLGYISMYDSCKALTFISLGYGVEKMLENNAAVGNLNSIGKLGNVDTVMCSRGQAFPPKKMFVTDLYSDGKVKDIREAEENESNKRLLKYALVCSDIKKNADEKGRQKGQHKYTGRKQDIALADACDFLLADISNLEGEFFRIDTEVSSDNIVTRTLVLSEGKTFVIVRGNPESVISRCVGYRKNGGVYRMNDAAVARMREALEEMGKKAETVIAVATGRTDADSLKDYSVEGRLILSGFIGLGSAFRVDPAAAVYKCRRAGIEAVLRSNDAYYPSLSLAKEAGIITDESQAISAEDISDTDPGLYIANQPLYKLYVGIDDEQWREVLKYRHGDKRYVAVTASNMDDLPLIHEADVTFVSDTETPDTLKQESDVIMLEGGFHVITYAIGAAKAIVARIHAVTEYLFVGFTAVLTAFIAAIAMGIEFPLRLQDMLVGGIIFNFIIAVSLAFAAPNKHILAEKMKKYRTAPKLLDFVYPVLYGVGAGGAITATYVLFGHTCALLSLAVLLITYGITNVSRKPIFIRTPLSMGKLVISALTVAAIFACIVYIPPVAKLFGYTQPSVFAYGITAAISLGYYTLTQLAKLIHVTIIKNKNKPKFKLAKDEEVN